MGDNPAQAPAVFTPEAVASINRAYAEAVDAIGGKELHPELRSKLAAHIMFLARNGETDERRLRDLSVIAVLGRTPERGLAAARRPAGWR